MANVSYPQYNLKTIVLPFTGSEDSMTLQEYKEKYGIDFRNFIVLESNAIRVRFGNAQVLLDPINETNHFLRPVFIQKISSYSADNSDATTEIGYFGLDEGDGRIVVLNGIDLRISQDDPFDIDHVYISGSNM